MPRGVKAKAAPAKKSAAAKTSTGRGRRIEPAKSVTWGTDDKRAQYARLVVFNFGVQEGLIPKKSEVNSATNAQLENAAKKLVGGTLIEGKEGIEYIKELSEKGSTTGRALTDSYAQEVRPFIRRMLLADEFGRRAGERKPRTSAPKTGTKTKTAGAKSKSATKKRATRSTRTPKAAPAAEVTDEAPTDAEGEQSAAAA